ncbi:hypothetical protein AUJ84_01510 [Candidatus Pacearchaeota archaeon CG1_02_32_132]|nr:MAG: hypothetical protein AUJ84_01510 [Candidatus Pacearchaeota archaeon CG1_02_32_132]
MVKKMINFKAIEKKWQGKWEKGKAFVAKDNVKGKKKFYVLEQYPYPSGSGLHMGHAFIYTIGDIFARFKRMQGYNVMHPMGFDSFGLPAENAAIKNKSHPRKFTDEAIKNFIKQMKGFGLSYDWDRMLKSHDPAYYKWDQWIFLKMLESGLAYRKKAGVNFCPKCNTVLANEQVVDGKCWRHEDTNVEVKQLEQWFLKTTDYADELLSGLDKLDEWPEMIKTLQRNWIGKSEGTEVDFEVGDEKKISNAIIIHGFAASGREETINERHWLTWIKDKLERKGIKTFVPLMPHVSTPKYNEWKAELEKLNKQIDERSILIGHSAGGAFLLRWLSETNKKINKLILVAPGGKHKKAYKVLNSGLYDFNLNAKIKDNVDEISIFISNDEVHRIENAEKYARDLGAKLIRLDERGHFLDRQMGTKEFPELLNEIVSGKKWKVFTTRVDTLFGATFLVVSAQHPELMSLVTSDRKREVEAFLKKVKSTKDEDRDRMNKEGVFTGSYAKHPLTGERIPIWTGNFVVSDYGSGIVMGVPAHDARDWDFAKKYGLKIKQVIEGDVSKEAYVVYGKLINSEGFSGLSSEEAKEHITIALNEKGLGRKKVAYKLRDWLISRQRFWGTPIPIIYCDNCGIQPVREKDLPVKLPENIKFQGVENPLKGNNNFVNVKCWKCGKMGRRETDTMDTFVDSSWYFLRYLDSKNKNKIFEKKKADYWMPIDLYIGGKEHATMHDIYFRFYTKFLSDLGLVSVREPAKRLFTQGFIYGEDGKKMSKSLGNVIVPEIAAKKYGVDGVRLFLVSVAGPDKDFSWSEEGAQGSLRFVLKVWDYFSDLKLGKSSKKLEHYVNKGIRTIGIDIENMKYNLAVIKLRELFGVIEKEGAGKKDLESFLKMFGLFCPHIAEELWSKIGGKGFVSLSTWPEFDEKKIDDKIEEADKALEKTVNDIGQILKLVEGKGGKAEKIYLYVLPQELKSYDENALGEKMGLKVKVYAVNDKNKYDPSGKSGKVKPGRPGIYVE